MEWKIRRKLEERNRGNRRDGTKDGGIEGNIIYKELEAGIRWHARDVGKVVLRIKILTSIIESLLGSFSYSIISQMVG